jgi:hypothetical protein
MTTRSSYCHCGKVGNVNEVNGVGGVARVVKCLPSKCGALSSYTSTNK